MPGVPVQLDIWSTLSSSLTSVANSIKTIVNPIGIIAMIICGIMYIVSQNPQTAEKAKVWGLRILIGVVVVNVADKIIEWAQTLK